MLRRVVVGLLLSVLLLSVVGLAGGSLSASDQPALAQSDHDEPALAQSAPNEFTTTTFEITVSADGNGTWTVRHSQPLEDDEAESQFETFAEEFRSTETEAFENFQERAVRLTDSGTEATGRTMTATEFERDAFIDERGQTTGVIEMSFLWTELAVENGDVAVLADIFEGGWAITESQRLVVRPGDDAEFATEPVPAPDSGLEGVDVADATSVTWFGERQFSDRRPRVEVTETADEDADGDGAADGGEDGEDDGMGMMPLAVGIVLLIGLGGAAAYLSGAFRGDGGAETADQLAEATGGADEGEAAAAGGAVPEEELLSDEDRVRQLLEENGGRMKQVAIVEETDWSKSKVSMLLSEMEDNGEISKLRVGRENIISLAGHEPEAAGSPFDDE